MCFIPLFCSLPSHIYTHTHTHPPFTALSVTILFTALMSVTLHDFPFCLDACHYLPNVTNIKETNQQRAVLNVVQAFHIDVPECHISTHFVTIYVFHFLFQFNLKKKHPLLYFSKIHTHVGCQWRTKISVESSIA